MVTDVHFSAKFPEKKVKKMHFFNFFWIFSKFFKKKGLST